jgi:hypothetical protein
LLAAAERAGDRGRALAALAIERGGLDRPERLARAVELAASARGGSEQEWERLARVLERGGSAVRRARAIALERAGRVAEALALFAELARDAPEGIALSGLARCLGAIDRHADALAAWDRVATASEGEARDRARLAAAVEASAAGEIAGALARLRSLRDGASGEVALAAHAQLVPLVERHAGAAALAELDRALPALADATGALHASMSAGLLRAAFARSIAAADATLARALLGALVRVLGEAGRGEWSAHEAALAALERGALTEGDATTLRARAEALRASGRGAEAARVLVEVFARTNDAAFLRAAIELADRSTDADARRAVFDRALEILPAGPAREAIAARRG